MTARLLLLNGPPGIGKSTLARRYVAERPLALCLDLDVVRALLGQWEERAHDAGLAARDLGVAMARATLRAGNDVVVPQYLGRPEFVERLAALAAEESAAFVHVVLLDSRERALARWAARGDETDGGAFYDRLVALVSVRPYVRLVETRQGDEDGAYAALLAAL